MDTWSILGSLVVIWYIFSRFGILYQEKSGNPAFDCEVGGHCAVQGDAGHPG
jgi:hypothetical protein